MRLLLDECIDERLRLLFPGHDCHLATLVPAAISTLGSLGPGDVVRIG